MVTVPLTALAVVIGSAGVLTVLGSVRRGSTAAAATGRGLAVWAALATVGLAVVLAVAVFGSLRTFGVMHYAYLVATVSLPMVGLSAAAASWRSRPAVPSDLRRRVAGGLAIAVMLLPAVVGFYATHIEPHWLRVDHVTVAVGGERQGDDPVTVGVLADLQTNHVGDHERNAVDSLVEAEPDVILIPGDLFHGDDDEYARELEAMRGLLARLHAPHGVYLVQGDADPPEWMARMIAGTDITVLDRDVVDLEIGDRRLRLGGHTLHPSGWDAEVVRNDLQQTTDPGVITVLLAHRPDTALYLPEGSRVDLTVAGHTHGGQIVVPGIGPLLTLSDVPRDVARGGLHRMDGNQIYVSPGVGIERGDAPQVRLFNRPAVAILTLR